MKKKGITRSRRTAARYGQRGVRVGEAERPGPPKGRPAAPAWLRALRRRFRPKSQRHVAKMGRTCMMAGLIKEYREDAACARAAERSVRMYGHELHHAEVDHRVKLTKWWGFCLAAGNPALRPEVADEVQAWREWTDWEVKDAAARRARAAADRDSVEKKLKYYSERQARLAGQFITLRGFPGRSPAMARTVWELGLGVVLLASGLFGAGQLFMRLLRTDAYACNLEPWTNRLRAYR